MSGFDVLVAGNANVQTRAAVPRFPLEYAKTRFAPHGIEDQPAGVALNVAAVLARSGLAVALATYVGQDAAGEQIASFLEALRIGREGVIRNASASARSVVLADHHGHEAIITDLKDNPQRRYPAGRAQDLIARSRHVHVTNIDWALDIGHRARASGKSVSTDVHHIGSLDDAYNARFLRVSNLVFFSTEHLHEPVADIIRGLWTTFDVEIAVCGQGRQGATIGVREGKVITRVEAAGTTEGGGTTGAGDAMTGSFLAHWLAGHAPVPALERAQRQVGEWVRAGGSRHGGCSPR